MTTSTDRKTARRIANRYEIDTFIAQGGMGAVYKGRDLQTGQIVAIKQLSQATVRDPELMLERFRRESEALRLLNHPNIVALHDAFQDGGEYYLIMDYISGGSLADRLRSGARFSVLDVIAIGLDVSDALTRSHRLKIVHRDLKPANVLLETDDTPRLTDFGVAQISDEAPLTESGTVVGTLAYLPPEAINGEMLDARADIWAFGVMLFEMLTGSLPFTGENPSKQVTAILNEPVPDLEALRPDAPLLLVDLIYRMLDKDKTSRIGSMRQVGAELETLLAKIEPPKATQIIHIRPKAGEGGATHTSPMTSTRGPSGTGLVPPVGPVTSRLRARRNLPAQTTPFVGREEELSELRRLLADPDTRLITILGPGGMGKTRLSIEAADQQSQTLSAEFPDGPFPDGVYFTALAPLTSPDLMVPAIGESVHFAFYQGGNERGQLLDFLREKRLLLVLDNFEHLIAGVDLVVDILNNAPHVKILISSRERLAVDGETLLRLDGMSFPAWETAEDALKYSAVQLFVQSARRARPGYVLITEQLAYVARICRMVEGLPLGIVLAAAWVNSLSLTEIADEIGKNIDFLETDARNVPARQQSLRAVFDYSWNMMTPDERGAFQQMSVFRGGFTREAGQEITGASLRTLNALINKSLLRRDANGRYEVHELLRQFAAQHLAATPDQEMQAQDSHARYYVAFVARQAPRITNSEQLDAIQAMETEIDNIRQGWQHAVERHDLAMLQQAADGLILFNLRYDQTDLSMRLFQLTVNDLRKAPQTGDYPHMLGLMLGATGYFKAFAGQREAALRDLREAETLIPADQYPRHRAWLTLFWMLPKVQIDESLGESHQQSLERLQEALTLAESIKDEWLIALLEALIAWVYGAQGDYKRSAIATAVSITEMQEIGDELTQLMPLLSIGARAMYRGEYAAARESFVESDRIQLKFHIQQPRGYSLLSLSDVDLHTGNYDSAREAIGEATDIFRQVGDRRGLILATSHEARLLELTSKPGDAVVLLTEALDRSRAIGNSVLIGTLLSLRAHAEHANARLDLARSDWQEALQLAIGTETIRVILEALAGLADLAIRDKQTERGVTILGFVNAHSAVTIDLQTENEVSLATARQSLAPELVEAALKRGASMTLAQIVPLAVK